MHSNAAVAVQAGLPQLPPQLLQQRRPITASDAQCQTWVHSECQTDSVIQSDPAMGRVQLGVSLAPCQSFPSFQVPGAAVSAGQLSTESMPVLLRPASEDVCPEQSAIYDRSAASSPCVPGSAFQPMPPQVQN